MRFLPPCALGGALLLLVSGCRSADDDDDSAWLAQDTAPRIDAGLGEAAPESELDAAIADASDGARPRQEPEVQQVHGPAFVASVTANGTGCPRGTWSTDIARDGESLVATFSRYEAEVDDGTRINFKDCNLSVRVHAQPDTSYSVASLRVQGYAYLEPGVRGFLTASYYFQGNPVPSLQNERRTDVTGPIDRSILFSDEPRPADAVWSPCGLERNLQVVTRIGLQKSQNKGAGYINLSSLDGNLSGNLVLRIKTRPCASAVDGGVR